MQYSISKLVFLLPLLSFTNSKTFFPFNLNTEVVENRHLSCILKLSNRISHFSLKFFFKAQDYSTKTYFFSTFFHILKEFCLLINNKIYTWTQDSIFSKIQRSLQPLIISFSSFSTISTCILYLSYAHTYDTHHLKRNYNSILSFTYRHQ